MLSEFLFDSFTSQLGFLDVVGDFKSVCKQPNWTFFCKIFNTASTAAAYDKIVLEDAVFKPARLRHNMHLGQFSLNITVYSNFCSS
jgi:hypothetical protein